MKKIALKNLMVSGIQHLTDDQLKNVLGGVSSVGDIDNNYFYCEALCSGGNKKICAAPEHAPGCTAVDNVGCSGYHMNGEVYHTYC